LCHTFPKEKEKSKQKKKNLKWFSIFFCVGGRGRTFEFDWRMDVVVVVGGGVYFSIRYWCVQ
jgi:hypothetical protein